MRKIQKNRLDRRCLQPQEPSLTRWDAHKVRRLAERGFGRKQIESAVKRLGIRYSAGGCSLVYAYGFAG